MREPLHILRHPPDPRRPRQPARRIHHRRGPGLLRPGSAESSSSSRRTSDASAADRDGPELPLLLREIASLPGRFWVRLLYIHPDKFPRGILDIMAADPRFLPYFDLPFQHASPGILRAMGRRGVPEANLGLLEEIRLRLPRAVIRLHVPCRVPRRIGCGLPASPRFPGEGAVRLAGRFHLFAGGRHPRVFA